MNLVSKSTVQNQVTKNYRTILEPAAALAATLTTIQCPICKAWASKTHDGKPLPGLAHSQDFGNDLFNLLLPQSQLYQQNVDDMLFMNNCCECLERIESQPMKKAKRSYSNGSIDDID